MLRRSEPQPVTFPTLPQRLQDKKPKGWAGPVETLQASAGLTASRFPSKLQDRGGGERRSSRLRASRCDPGGKALGVRHFGCLCRSVQLPREPPTETRWGEEAAAVLSEKGSGLAPAVQDRSLGPSPHVCARGTCGACGSVLGLGGVSGRSHGRDGQHSPSHLRGGRE